MSTLSFSPSRHCRAAAAAAIAVACVAALSACSPYVGVGVPLGPFSVGVGVGSGGVSAGVGTGVGPVGVGVGVNQRGQVTGNAGVGVGTSVGGANVGVGVGTGTVLYDPAAPVAPASAPATAPDYARSAQPGVVVPGVVSPPAGEHDANLQWRGADGQLLPDCRLNNRC
ncbi:hypothetical protein [Comamonas sp. B21-038]|uniref:hypothetical protein n=1 Tax=Comamonas sp. B21-038 TaxID=2918299 RepID=UPI001EFB4AB0|nr:hypothetical protein [Comamonas sp. B21-038]ULR88272.1 hypothetical protein MJ205_17795 [Comamonas sp. B21-038]